MIRPRITSIARLVLLSGVSLLALSGTAEAAPVVAFFGGALNALGAGTWLASGAVGAWTAGFAVGQFLGTTIVGRLVLSLGINAIASALYRPRFPQPSPQEIQTNFSQPLASMQRVYGRVRKGGPILFTGFKQGTRFYAVAIAAHRTKGPVDHWLDVTEVEIATHSAVNVLADVLLALATNTTLSGEIDRGGVLGFTSNDRVLLRGQTNPVENGIWVTSSGAWTRPADFNATTPYQMVQVTFAPSFGVSEPYHTNMTGKVVGTDAQAWSSGAAPQPFQIMTAPMTGYGTVRTYTGQPGQAAPPLLLAYFPEITSAHDFAQISYALVTASRCDQSVFTQVYPGGQQWTYSAVWDGHDAIYDPRTDTYGWTQNAALILAHEALFHGKQVDWDQVAIEADAADVLVTNGDGGTQRRWTLNAVLDDNVPWEQARDMLARACDAFFFETVDGKVGFRVGRYIAPTLTLTDRDFRGLSVADQAWGPDVPGEAVVKYTEPAQDWQQSTSGAIVVEAGLPRLEDDIWAINSHNQACRVAKRMIRRARARYTLRGDIGLIGFEAIGERFFRAQVAELGLDQVFEIDRLIRNADGVSFTVEATSTEAADWAFAALTEEPDRPERGDVASDDSVATITGLSGEVVTGTGGVAQIEWSWPAQAVGLTQVIRVRSLDGGMTEWQELSAGEGQRALVMGGLTDGALYEAEARNRTASGRVGDWSASVSVTAIANTTPPVALTAFAVTDSGTTGEVAFTAPNDPNYAATRIWRGPTSSFGAATLVQTEYGVVGMADAWNDTGLAPGTYYYWAAPVNGSGIEGPLSGPDDITII